MAGNFVHGKDGRFVKQHGHTRTRPNGTKHRSPTYQSWRSMIARCYDAAHPWFHAYGERGIAVCDEWRGPGGFVRFLADMGERPATDLTLDRVEVDGGYCKANCRWADKSTQRCNIRVLPKPARIKRGGRKKKGKKNGRVLRVQKKSVADTGVSLDETF